MMVDDNAAVPLSMSPLPTVACNEKALIAGMASRFYAALKRIRELGEFDRCEGYGALARN
jgi:hypothetical protein